MVEAYLGLGSNRDRYQCISAGLDAIERQFGAVKISPVFESESIGFEGSLFLNLVVAVETELSVAELDAWCKSVEKQNGHDHGSPKYSPRTLDIDILLYGDLVGVVDGVELPRGEIVQNAFVLWPLAELIPDRLHPALKLSYSELWQRYDQAQSLWPVSFTWQGQELPKPSKVDRQPLGSSGN